MGPREEELEPSSTQVRARQPENRTAPDEKDGNQTPQVDEAWRSKRSRQGDADCLQNQQSSKRVRSTGVAIKGTPLPSTTPQPQQARDHKQLAAERWSFPPLLTLSSTSATPVREFDLSRGRRLPSLPRVPPTRSQPARAAPLPSSAAERSTQKSSALNGGVQLQNLGRVGLPPTVCAEPSRLKQATPAGSAPEHTPAATVLDLCPPDEDDEASHAFVDAPEADVDLVNEHSSAQHTHDSHRTDSNASASPEHLLPAGWDWSRMNGLEGFYPPTAKASGVLKLAPSDLASLDPGAFANDQVMNLYIKMLEASLSPREPVSPGQRAHATLLQKRVVLLNNFFYTKLTRHQSGQDDTGHDNVMRWTTKRNVFDARFIFVPIHSGCHWSLAVICNAEDLLEYAVAGNLPALHGGNATQSPCHFVVPAKSVSMPMDIASTSAGNTERYPLVQILHLDPLPGTHNTSSITTALASWLLRELEVKLELQAGQLNELQPRIAAVQPTSIPHQPNYHDCGLFVLTYMEQMLLHVPERIAYDAHAPESTRLVVIADNPWEEPWTKSYMRSDWFKPSDPAMLRARLQFLGVNIMYSHSAQYPGLHAQLDAAGDFMTHYRKLKVEKYSGTFVSDKEVCQ